MRLVIALFLASTSAFAAPFADVIYEKGVIRTFDGADRTVTTLAVKDGVILYAGDEAGAATYRGAGTGVIDLQGKTVLPGLVDGHIHPVSGGGAMIACNLNYEALSVDQVISRIQACLDKEETAKDDDWLTVRAWFRQAMTPKGADMTSVLLDRLKTRRPVKLRSSDGHTLVTNSRGLALSGVTNSTPNPKDGVIGKDANGRITGVFEDGAQEFVDRVIPEPAPAEKAALIHKKLTAAFDAMAGQGITSFYDASVDEAEMAVYGAMWEKGELPLRAHLAFVTGPEAAADPKVAVAKLKSLEKTWTRTGTATRPGLSLHHTKLFLDGVVQGPAFTAALMEPYLVNAGSADNPHYVPGKSRGEYYFTSDILNNLLIELGKNGIDPHLHTDGDGAVNQGLNAVAAMRAAIGPKDIRPAFAHNETVIPGDYARFASLNVVPVVSMQWGKPAQDTIDTVKPYIGPDRFNHLEPAGKFQKAGARIAYGSDWPVDGLDHWFALKVGVTRENVPGSGYDGRLGDDPGLTVSEALKAITVNSSWQLRQEKLTGTLEGGKYADFIVLDRDPFRIPAAEIANVKVLKTFVGGKLVFER